MERKVLPEVYLGEDEIQQRVKELGFAISKEFEGQELVVICMLKGAFIFCADIVREINLPLKVDYLQASSYGDGTVSSGNVKVKSDISIDIKNKNVLVVEDIVDTGLTLSVVLKMLNARGPKSLKLASLLYKPSRNTHPIDIDYLGFEIEDKFVVGYGLDYAGNYRELPYVGILNDGQ